MAALPYIQLYVADYLADTAHLTTAQHGAYLLLIFNYWQRGQALDNANDRLANVARMSNEEWQNNKQALMEFFNIDGDMWHHARIDADLSAVKGKSTNASKAGKASAATRQTKAKRTKSERSTVVEQTLNHTDTDTDKSKERQAAPAAPFDFKADLFAKWKDLPQSGGGAFLSKLFRDYKPDDRVVEAVERTLSDTRADPKAFVLGILKSPQASEKRIDGWTLEESLRMAI